jgi:bacillaene synthase trans-acting acyltransferase
MNKSIVFMFSGQGSQFYNMGKDFYLSNNIYRENMIKLDKVFKDIVGDSVISQLYGDKISKGNEFNRTLYTHPAIFMQEYSLAQVLLDMGIYPDYVLGSSLGEFVSATVAGVMSYEDTMENLIKQAQLLEASCSRGSMIAVVNDYSIFNEAPELHQNSELAAVNYQSHFVVSGSLEGLAKVERYLSSKEVLYVKLPVSFAFHSSHVNCIEQAYIDYLKSKSFKEPKVAFVSCLTGKKETYFDFDYFWKVVREPMDFPSALHSISKEKECIYIDLGPSGTLANFAKYNLPREMHKDVFSIITPFNNNIRNLDKLDEAISNNQILY